MPRRNKRDTLTPQEIHAFLQSAEQFNHAICQPLISPQGAHYKALRAVQEALLRSIEDISGKEAHWISRTPLGPAPGPE
jgi:hypothetical protein